MTIAFSYLGEETNVTPSKVYLLAYLGFCCTFPTPLQAVTLAQVIGYHEELVPYTSTFHFINFQLILKLELTTESLSRRA